MESFKKTLAALLLVSLLAAATAFPRADPPPAGGDSGSSGSSGSSSSSGSSGGSGGECSQKKVCTGSLAKIDINARIGTGICLLDSLTKKLLFFKNRCASKVAQCSNKSTKYTEVDSNKCGA
ncbi:uncharacterized protein LOC111046450 [Nilaparvata lugens]|uniref:uncharacterized protein LOC111046450 n=1 Tax=Nilaparvata lugens TaxID=108931 RepID=UPI000B98FF80|nr:uncharacterized protein LOC111046450 [Nilaparvata lugens]